MGSDYQPEGFQTAPIGYGAVERAAVRVRSLLTRKQAEPDDRLDCVALFESLHEFHVSAASADTVDWIVIENMRSVEAFATFIDNRFRLALTDRTYQGLRAGIPRARFTFAHEVGHLALHSSLLVTLGGVPHGQSSLNRGGTHKAYEDTEWQADAFAGALLMPAKGLAAIERRHGILTTAAIADNFGVSGPAAETRYEKFKQHRAKMLAGGE